MIPYEIDPSLHPAPPVPPQIGDGFAPPQAQAPALPVATPSGHAQHDLAGEGLAGEQSAF